MLWCEIAVHIVGALACLSVVVMTVIAARWALAR